jgi:alpha-L-rhamnosidase
MKTAVLALVVVIAAVAAPAARANNIRVTDLKVEHLDHPLGIDAAVPRLAWQLASHERGQTQTAYQVLVASSEPELARNRGDVWDSGRVQSDRSIDVPYGGPPLRSGRRYRWKVRVWDRDDERSEWSRSDWWEMGLLEPSDWQAEWIGRPRARPVLDLEGSHWIWYPEGDPAQSAPAGTRYFRSHVELPAGREVERATLTVTADNEVVAYVNGERVASGADWTRAQRADVSERLEAGDNVLAISAVNHGGPGAVIGRLRVEFTSGDPLVIDTGSGFKAMNAEEAGWQTPSHDDSAWPAALEAATYGDPPWGNGVTAPAAPVSATVLRKPFSAAKQVVRARAYVSGIGYYVLRLNGQRVGDRVLDPTYTEYEDTVLYSTYDVTHAVRRGANVLEATVAPGFYYYDAPKLLLHVKIEYADGSSEIVATDGSWSVATAPTSFDTGIGAEVFGGETFDARAEPSDWRPADLVAPPGGRLVAQAIEPVTVSETVEPDGVAEPRPGTYVVDMGRTLTGWIRLRAIGGAGTKVSIQYGEKLNADGTVNAIASPGPRPRWQRDEYVFRGGGTETWEPSFTFKSFRYVQLDGLAARPDVDDVRGRVVHSAVADEGAFASSSSLYDRIHHAMRRSMLGGMLGYPAIDPAHEKNGWAGDTQLITPSMIDNFGVAAYLTKWLDDVRDSQRADGSISMIDPIRDGCCYAWAPEWTGAYPIVAWELYLRYGSRRVLESHYDALVRYLGWQTGSLTDGIAPASTWGDWASPGYGVGPEDRRLTATAYVYRQAEIMADIASALGRDADAERFRATANHIRERFNEVFLNEETGRYETASDPGYRQASNGIPLAFGMVPAENEDAVLEGLVSDVRARGDRLNTGILGTPALLEALTRGGHADLAHAIASQTTYPSWGEWIVAGADTMWESWGFGGRSRNHPMHGTVDDWFFREVAGIEPLGPGYKRTLIQPHPGSLTSARAEHESPYGEIASAWSIADGVFTLAVTIPVNTTATVRVPVPTDGEAGPVGDARGVQSRGVTGGYAEFRVGSGSYRFAAPRE